ncbi:galactose mutarotase-like protein [Apiospora kogelbergensis]|uniref:galactose mutarotase-like protein n=1 Tax=Apiospora kogelbergensis TaxID=1337665 RepID=UPI00312D162A
MHLHARLLALGASLLPMASAETSGSKGPGPDKDGLYWIKSEGLMAGFITYGASLSHMLVKDQYGIPRDVVAGFDNATYYEVDKQHNHFGGVPGRYANRIRNSTFELDGDITFSIVDPDGKEGFPGEVVSYITYTVSDWTWDFKMVALATTKKTPIMLSSHVYWNLDGFANNETNTVLNHTFHLPYSGQRVGVDNILIPTGDILANQKGSVNDFWSAPKQIGASFSDPELKDNCGFNCTGYDNCWLVNRAQNGPYDWRNDGYVARLHSAWSGIQLDVYSDQEAFQLYSCNGQNGSVALKTTQGLKDNKDFPRTIPKYGCVVMEVEDWIDAINQPAWGRQDKQIIEPGGDPYVLQASYRFSINGTSSK